MTKTYQFFQGIKIAVDDGLTANEIALRVYEAQGKVLPRDAEGVVFNAESHNLVVGKAKCQGVLSARSTLCVGCYQSGNFFYVEGGWGHHVAEIGKAFAVNNGVMMVLRFGSFNNWLVVNGELSVAHLFNYLHENGLVDGQCKLYCWNNDEKLRPYVNQSQITCYENGSAQTLNQIIAQNGYSVLVAEFDK